MRISLTFTFLLVINLAFAQAWQQKVDPELLDKFETGGQIEAIILFSKKADLSNARFLETKNEKAVFVFNRLNEAARSSQKEALAILENANAFYKTYTVYNAVYSVFSKKELEKIALLSTVEKILPNPALKFDAPEVFINQSKDSTDQMPWGIQMIQADEVWKMKIKGEGVVIGGQDTGYDWTHPALQRTYRGKDTLTGNFDHNYNWHDAIHELSPLSTDSMNNCGLNLMEPCDDGSHGTHTMGTMVGAFEKERIGVAPEANWIGCRNMEEGNGAPATYLECFDWFLAPTDLNGENPDPTKSPHVINNSWYCSEGEGCLNDNLTYFETVINNLKAAGVVVVVSAGNNGRQGCATIATQPPIYENSFSVGATNSNDAIAQLSSRGPVMIDGSNRMKPNVSAPGIFVYSSTPGSNFGYSSGTSMAGPHVAGTVALMISANPSLAGKVEEIETILENTAVPKTDTIDCGGFSGMQVPNPIYGYGRIDAFAAVQAALTYSSSEQVSKSNSVEVFPNPTTGRLFFKNKELMNFEEIQIFDSKGNLILSEKIEASQSQFSISLADRASGIYFYNLISNQKTISGKVIKK